MTHKEQQFQLRWNEKSGSESSEYVKLAGWNQIVH